MPRDDGPENQKRNRPAAPRQPGGIIDTAFTHRAAGTGLTEALVRQVIDAFYAKVRRDPALGPVFDGIIGDDWPAHIERITAFWLTVTRLRSGYQRQSFMPAHLKHGAIRAALLPRWLELFGETATETCPPEAAAVLIDIAERMADFLDGILTRRDAGISANDERG